MARKIPKRLVAQAQATAFLKTNPEASSLIQLLKGAGSDYQNQVAVERGAARGVIGSIDRALPAVRHNYALAAQTANTAQQVVDRKLAPLSPVADDFRAASALEHAGFLRRIGETRASTLGELQSRKVDARAGQAFAVRTARDQFRADKQKIGDRLLEVKREQGAAFESALSRAIQQEADNALKKRGQNLTFKAAQARVATTRRGQDLSHQDRVANRRAQQNKDLSKLGASVLAGPKKDRPTRTQRVAARDKYEQGVSYAQQLRQHDPHASEAEITAFLTPKLGSALLARAAAQTAIYRGVGPITRRKAHGRYGVKLPPFPKRRPSTATQAGRNVAQAAGLFR